MKKTLLLPLLLVTQMTVGKTLHAFKVSDDPRDPNFVMYWNPLLCVEGISVTGASRDSMFGEDAKYIDCLKDSICVVLRQDHYKIWFPEIHMMFSVRPIGTEPLPLGDHCTLFVNVLRDFRKNRRI